MTIYVSAGFDFALTESVEVVIDAGNTTGCIDLQTNEDDVYEEDELIMVTLFSTGDTQITINGSAAIVEITDDDGRNLTSLYLHAMLSESS